MLYFIYAFLNAIFLLSFGIFNSVLRIDYHVEWLGLVLLLCMAILAAVSKAATVAPCASTRNRWEVVPRRYDAYSVIIILYLSFDALDLSFRRPSQKELILKVYVDDKLMETSSLEQSSAKTVVLHVQGMRGRWIHIRTEVNRTFNPKKIGLSDDDRDLGVLMSEMRFPNLAPSE